MPVDPARFWAIAVPVHIEYWTSIGDDTGTTFRQGQKIELKLSEANPASGALKFELPEGKVQKWMGRRPGLISKLLSGKPTPIATWPVNVVDGNLILTADD